MFARFKNRRSGDRCVSVVARRPRSRGGPVFHFHLHVIPRYAGDGCTLEAESQKRERSLPDSDAQAIKNAIASSARS